MHSVFGKINYGGLKHNSLYLGLAQPEESIHENVQNLSIFFEIFDFLEEKMSLNVFDFNASNIAKERKKQKSLMLRLLTE